MAEGRRPDPVGEGLEKLTQEITCPICHDFFQEPKILPCLHYYCKSCVEQLAARAGQGRPFPCPECRKEATLRQNDASRLPTAFFVNRMRTIHETMKKARKVELCSKHEEPLKIYCLDCDQLICHYCSAIEHKSHRYEFVKTYYEVEVKQMLANKLAPLRAASVRMSAPSARVRDKKVTVSAQGKEMEHSINLAFDRIVQAAERRRVKVIDATRKAVGKKLDKLTAQEKSFGMLHAEAESLLTFADHSLSSASEGEILSVHKQILQRADETSRALESVDIRPTEEPTLALKLPDLGKISNIIDQGSAIISIEGSGISQAEIKKDAKITICVQPREVRSIQKTELRSVFDNSATRTTVVAKGNGVYEVSYRSSVRGRHQLSISLSGVSTDVQIPAFVKPPTQLKDPVRRIEGFDSPFYCCISDEQLLVTERHKGSVVSMDRRASGGTDIKIVVTGLNQPTGIATDECGFTYVTEAGSSRVQVFDKDWKVVRTLDRVGSQPGELNCPGEIAVGADRKVYVCDRGNDRVQVFDENLHHIQSVVPKDGEKKKIVGVACDGTGNLYAADSAANTVYKFDKDGQLVSTIGDSGAHTLPTGLCVHDEFLYISEFAAHQVSVYTLDGKYVTSLGQDSLKGPCSIAIDSDGFVYVCDLVFGSVVVF